MVDRGIYQMAKFNTMKKINLICSLAFLCVALLVTAQEEDKKKKWDINKPLAPYDSLVISVDEGTWMNLDVSPDGKTIVFDLLGDIYKMPVTGGKAEVLLQGHAWEIQPRFSPDGKRISFTSDREGADNIWTMDINGEDLKQVTKETFRLLNNAVWTPDGQYLIARKHFTSTRSLGAGEMWMYHRSGGNGIQLTKKKNDQQDAGEPCISPDGRYLFFSEDMYPGGFFQYNKDPNDQIYVIRRYDRKKGELKTLVGGPGGAVRPQISPNGEKMAFVRRVRSKSVLFVRDLATGINRPVYDDLSKDQQEAWAIFGVYPNYNWLPDNRHVIIWAEGKIRKIDTKTGGSEIIPFEAEAMHRITQAVRFKQNPDPDHFNAKVIRGGAISPDGQYVAFNAAGYLYIKELPDGEPKRLTKGTDFEFEPSWSPDGQRIIFVTWNDEEKGAIVSCDRAGGNQTKWTKEKGLYRNPSYAPDGQSIIFQKESGNSAMGYAYGANPGIYLLSMENGETAQVTEEGAFPKFSPDGQRIYYMLGGYLFGKLKKAYCSVDLRGKDKRVHFQSKYSNQFAISPDNKWLAFTELYDVYIMPFSETGQTFDLSAKQKALPLAKVSDDAGLNLQWRQNSSALSWMMGEELYTVELQQAFDFLEGSPDSIGQIKMDTIAIELKLETDRPEGSLAFINAKIITMNGEEVIEKGGILINGNRIEAVGSMDVLNIPQDVKVIDAEGKTIVPGFIDTHAHLNAFRYGITPQKEWPYYANLAYGITCTHDPSSNTEMSLSNSEMVRAGHMVGPRIFTTGTILYGAEGDFKAVINSYEDAHSAIHRTAAFGAFTVKSYNQPRRNQRQQVIKAAREQEVMIYPEGGSTFFHNMTMILDGHTSVEHNIPVAPLYNDVLQLWGASQTANTPTLIVNYGGVNGEYYWYQHSKVWENEKLLKYTPRKIIDSRSRHRKMIPQEEYENGHILSAQSCKKLVDNGVHVCVGGHGQLQGLGAHWEMWMLAQGGLSNFEVLRAATLHGAQYIGMGDDLGSLEKGKLADLVVLEEDPLQDIQNTQTVKYTVINGRVYDTETMNEIGNYDSPRNKFFWEMDGYNDDFEWHSATNSFAEFKCLCGQ